MARMWHARGAPPRATRCLSAPVLFCVAARVTYLLSCPPSGSRVASNEVTMTRADLTGYAALFGESLTSKVDLLGRLLGDSHYPSLGQYKERLLADAIRGFLPRTVEVGTGFVMFPHADMNPPAGGQFYDPLNHSAFSMSRQCDILSTMLRSIRRSSAIATLLLYAPRRFGQSSKLRVHSIGVRYRTPSPLFTISLLNGALHSSFIVTSMCC
jgi:hypothetical protein